MSCEYNSSGDICLKEKIFDVLPHAVSFVVIFATLLYEFSKTSSGFYSFGIEYDNKTLVQMSKSLLDNSYILYLGSFISYMLEELIYKPFYKTKFSRWGLILASLFGAIISIVGLTVPPYLYSTDNFFIFVIVTFIIRWLIVIALLFLVIGYGIKIYHKWNIHKKTINSKNKKEYCDVITFDLFKYKT